MSDPASSVVDTRPLAIGIVSAMRAMGSVIPPHAEKFLELSFTWLLNDAQAQVFSFAALAAVSLGAHPLGSQRLAGALNSIGADTGAVADRAKAELAAMGKPS
jgi:hypothetical protein